MLLLNMEEDLWDEDAEIFVRVNKNVVLKLEHSLISASKWEAHFHKPFINTLNTDGLSVEETIYYIRCMALEKYSEDIYNSIRAKHIKQVDEYMKDPMSATVIYDTRKNGRSRPSITTTEQIYEAMFVNQIPMECEKWHLNRLLILLQLFAIRNNPDDNKMSQEDQLAEMKRINQLRKQQFNTKG